jgi:hypothetical protein
MLGKRHPGPGNPKDDSMTKLPVRIPWSTLFPSFGNPAPGTVAVATQRGVTAVVGSVERIPSGLGLFDTVLLLGNNLSLLASAERAAVVLGSLPW